MDGVRRIAKVVGAVLASAAAWLIVAVGTFFLAVWVGYQLYPAVLPCGWSNVAIGAAFGMATLVVGLYWALGVRDTWARAASALAVGIVAVGPAALVAFAPVSCRGFPPFVM